MSRISDSLLEAFDIAISERIDRLEYDKTIQATITEIANADEGEYRVKYKEGIISAFAYDPTEVFKIGDIVYVTVPQGDFGNKKFISHKLSNNSLSTGQYKDLSNTIIDVSSNFLGLEIDCTTSAELTAGAPEEEIELLGDVKITVGSTVMFEAPESTSYQWQYYTTNGWRDSGLSTSQNRILNIAINQELDNLYRCKLGEGNNYSHVVRLKIQERSGTFVASATPFVSLSDNFKLYANKYEYVKISADFMTTLPINTPVTKGDYGLVFTFRDENDQLVPCVLDISDFTGDPYNLWTWFPQSLIIKLPEGLQSLEGVKFYEKDFVIEEDPSPNLFVRNISLSFVESIDLTNVPYYLSVLSNNGLVFSDTVQQIALTGHIIHYGQELNPKSCIYQWFERDLTVDTGSEFYDKRVGWGWKAIADATSKILTIHKNNVAWSQQSYKLLVVFDENVVMTQEATLLKQKLEVEVIQKAVGDTVTLDLNPSDGYKASWYYLTNNGTQQPLQNKQGSVTESEDIIPYLYYSSSTFYCSVSNTNDDFLGELVYTIKNIEAIDDVTVIFTGISFFSYDANGDINIQDSELERSLTPVVTFNNGISSAVKYKWFLNEHELQQDEIYTPSDSMIKDARFDPTTNTLYYKIKHKFRLYPAENNTFKFQIITLDGETYVFEKEIVCTKTGDPGTNGTKYQVLITTEQDSDGYNRWYVRTDSGSTGWQAYLKCQIFKDDELYTIGNPKNIEWKVFNLQAIGDGDQDGIVTGPNIQVFAGNKTDNKRYVRLTVKIKDEEVDTTLYSFYAVPTFSSVPSDDDKKIDLSLLPKYVQYNASGLNPQYLKTNLANTHLAGITVPPDQKNITIRTTLDNSSIYLKAIDKFDSTNGNNIGLVQIPLANKTLYYPIVMYINTFGNEAINGWDGTSVSLGDDDTHAIFAPQVGAGKKENDNTFTGVVMGQDSGQEKRVGLYGYQKGVTSFALMEDGTAFFGTSSNNRITLNGKDATIQGGGGGTSTTGMAIKLASTGGDTEAIRVGNGKFIVKYDGSITSTSGTIGGWYITDTTLQDKKLLPNVILDKEDGSITGANFYAPNKASPSFQVNGSTGEITAKAGTIGGWSISSTQLSCKSGSVVLNSNGTISGATIVGGSIKVPNNSTPAFEVNEQGKMTCTGADIQGKITATEGRIGGWYITSTTLQNSENNPTVYLDSSNGTVYGASMQVPATGEALFKVESSGKMTCTSAEIGGWMIDSDGMHKTVSSGGTNYEAYLVSNTVGQQSNTVLKIGDYFSVNGWGGVTASNMYIAGSSVISGSLSAGNGTFQVNSTGKLTCSDAEITGTINANTLKILINNSYYYTFSLNLYPISHFLTTAYQGYVITSLSVDGDGAVTGYDREYVTFYIPNSQVGTQILSDGN